MKDLLPSSMRCGVGIEKLTCAFFSSLFFPAFSLLIRCFIVRELYGNSTGIAREGLEIDSGVWSFSPDLSGRTRKSGFRGDLLGGARQDA